MEIRYPKEVIVCAPSIELDNKTIVRMCLETANANITGPNEHYVRKSRADALAKALEELIEGINKHAQRTGTVISGYSLTEAEKALEEYRG
jgi:hypothetical protein